MADLMVGLVRARCLRVNTVGRITIYIKDLIKNENCIQVHAFITRTLKPSNEVLCVLRFAHTSVHHAKDYQ